LSNIATFWQPYCVALHTVGARKFELTNQYSAGGKNFTVSALVQTNADVNVSKQEKN